MGAGYRFTLGAHPIKMVNGEYTITALDVVGVHPDFLADGQAVYRNRFRCVPSHVAPRPKRPARRPKPGMEVARVVGFIGGDGPGLEANPAGYARVRFRWDILDDDYATPRGSLQMGATDTDDVYSVWLPIVQPWAGAGYGAQFIPREGMEVLVGFMEDQSERPVILGCVYSQENQPPWPAYIDHQKVGIRSQTRPADGGYSELSIDDRSDGEMVTIRGQKDLSEHVLHDRTAAIDHDVAATIGHDDTLSVANDRFATIGANDTRTVGRNDTLTVKADSSTDIGGNVSVHVVGTTQEALTGDVTRAIAGRVTASTQGDTQLRFASDYTERHLGHRTVIVGAGGAHRTAVVHVEGTGRAYASKSIEVEVLDTFTLICGDSQILVSPKGITLSSPHLSLVGKAIDATAGTFAATASGSLTLGGQTATMRTSGAQLALDASTANLTGSKVKLGSGTGDTSQATDQPATITHVQMKDPQGKPRANARVLLLKGGKDGEQRMTVLDENGTLELVGDASYQIVFPDDPAAK
jgi:type VI secretion system secreted protein VgrG